MFRVLVTACLGPSGTSVMTLLDAAIFKGGLSDIEVIGIDAASGEVPLATAPDYLDRMTTFAAGFDLIIPGCDEEALALADDPRSACRSRAAVELAGDKAALYWALRAPLRALGGDTTEHFVGAFIKRRTGRGGAGAYSLGTEWLACEDLSGPEYSVDLVRWGGVIRGLVARRRERIVRGTATAGTIVGGRLESWAAVAVETLRLEGPACVQFKERADGLPVLTDVNARFGGGVTISAEAGVNLPELLVRLAREEDVETPVPKPGRYVSTVERRPEQ